jgi:hypothetical protein
MISATQPLPDPCRWLVLLYQLPAQPAYLRTKIWRRLQAIGAVPVRSSAYVLPIGDEAREDFHWLVAEIAKGGGEAAVCEARLVDGLRDEEVEAQFNAVRDEAYAVLIDEAQLLLAETEVMPGSVNRLRRRFEAQVAIDFFAARRRDPAEKLLLRLEERARGTAPAASDGGGDLIGRVWVTREHLFVDRLACAWAVRRFIDPDARFKFVPAQGYRPQPGEIRFDMFEGEIGHEGDRCSLEVLIARAGLERDDALRAIAEVVHDIDLKDDSFGRPETPGILHLLKGVCAPGRPDEQRIARATAIFNDLYDSYAGNGQ